MIDQYIHQYGKRLYGLCLTLCASTMEADDLYQDTWLQVVKNISRYDASRDFEPWLTKICVNLYRNALRRLSKSPFLHFRTNEEVVPMPCAMITTTAAIQSTTSSSMFRGGEDPTHSGFGQSTSIFGTTLKLELEPTGNDGTLFNIMSSAENVPNLKITLGGERIPCNVDTVDVNPTVYYIVPQYDELEPGAADFFMPERISEVHIVGNSNVGSVEILHDDLAFDILVGIDSAPYLDLEHDIYGTPDGSGGYDFKDGFEIRIEYQTHDELFSHADMITCLVFEQGGSSYLIDDRPDNGRIFRQIDETFYHELESLFE